MREIAKLFNYLPMVVFWVKNTEGKFVQCNRGFELLHDLASGEVIGKTDYDLHPAAVSARYQAEDALVIERDEPLTDQVWMVPDGKGILRWWISSKTPVRDESGVVTGVAGAMYEISTAAGMFGPYQRLEKALAMLHENYAESLKASDLAKVSNLSLSQFNRVFWATMGTSAKDYLSNLRVEMAKSLLLRSNKKLAEIATDVGFYDGSEFGKRFKKREGVTPRSYRMRFQK